MKAVGVTTYGAPEALEVLDLPTPSPGPGEVRVRVRAATVNPTDTLLRVGAHAARFGDREPPYVPGMDAAGVIDALGPDSGDRLRVGQRVVALVVPTGPHGGAYAEQIVLPAASVVAAPEGADFAAASTLLMNALTARLALDDLGPRPGDPVAVTGAAGAFGGYAVALAKADGLRVIADAAAKDEALVRSLGADEVVPRGEGFSGEVRALVPGGVPGLADGALLHEAALPAIADGGGIAVVRGWGGPSERGIAIHPVAVARFAEETAALSRLVGQAEDGTLALRVAEVLPAEEAAEAHRRLEAGGVRGRLVLDFGGATTD
jgi:NADPH2:quinone reductase